MKKARRALLYMPGDDVHKIEKATRLRVDCICMDMEDGVALNKKEEARQTIARCLRELDFGRAEQLVRINGVGTGLEEADLEVVLPFRPDGIVIPKVERTEQVIQVSSRIGDLEQANGITVGSTTLVVIVESALGIVNLREIAASDRRLTALVFGAEDLAADMGAVRTPSAWEVFYARSALVTNAAAFNLQAIDMVYVDYHDEAGLREEAIQGMRMGFSGKQVIHPNQVRPVQDSYTPDGAAVAEAQALLSEFEAHQSRGIGAFAYQGKMVDAPMIRNAERVLERARAAGMIA